jgi:hypothetical protein
MKKPVGPAAGAVADALRRGFLAGGALRKEDARKAQELTPLLLEIARAAAVRQQDRFLLVDACAGKAAAALLSAHLVLRGRGGPYEVVAIEREPARAGHALAAAKILGVEGHLRFVTADVAEEDRWPPAPDIVVALHACGRAADIVIDRATASGSRRLLLVPCCYGGGPRHDGAAGAVTAQPTADAWARRMELPRQGLVGRRFAQAVIDAERTLRLEAAGYETEVVELFSPTVSPHNLLWRARRVREPGRMAEAKARLAALAAVGRDDAERAPPDGPPPTAAPTEQT